MVEYRINKDEKRRQINQFLIYISRTILIIAVVAFLIGITILVYGCVSKEKTRIEYGGAIVIGDVLVLIGFLLRYKSTMNNLIKDFECSSVNNEKIVKISIEEPVVTFENKTCGDIINYKLSDMGKGTIFKNIIVFKLVSKQYLFIPNTEQTRELFKNHLFNKDGM